MRILYLFFLLLMIQTLSGCQHTRLSFTPVSAPSIPEFTPIAGAPQVTPVPLQLSSLVPRIRDDSAEKIYLFPNTADGLNHLRLVAISPDKPFFDIDILLQAFAQKRTWLIAHSSLACADTLQFHATIHSISIGINCQQDSPQDNSQDSAQNSAQALHLLASFWQIDAFESLDIATLRRQLKLKKHKDAYSGDEINTVWAAKILGTKHPYNQALNNAALADELTLSRLKKVQRRSLTQANWMMLSNQAFTQQRAEVKQARALLQRLASESSSGAETGTRAETDTGSTNLSQSSQMQQDLRTSNTGDKKILYLIDAPGSLQTQVRVGYSLASGHSVQQSNPASMMQEKLRCQFLASWLGRGFSGRLFFDLREVRGLTYGIYGHCYDKPLARTLKFYASTKTEHSGAFISGILDHLALAKEQQIPAAELSAIKTYLTSEAQLRQDNLVQAEYDFIEQQTAGLTGQDKQDYFNRLNALTPASAQKIAQRVFAAAPVILIRGDASIIQQDIQNKLKHWIIKKVKVE